MKRILILVANPKSTSPLRLDRELQEIKKVLERSQNGNQFIFKHQLAVSPRDIHRAILETNPQIFHFSGHGKGEEGLVFEDETGKTKLISGDALASLFELFAARIECVVLNGCYLEMQAEAIAQHINYVIGISQAISDSAAIHFIISFYDAVAMGTDYEFAYNLACNSILMAGIYQADVPVLKKKANSNINSAVSLWVHGWVKQSYGNSPTVELDWTEYFDINTQPRRIADQATWNNILLPSLVQARDKLTQGYAELTIDVRGKMPLTAAVAIGTVFPDIKGYTLQVEQRTAGQNNLWRSDASPSNAKFKVVKEEGKVGQHLLIAFGITGNPLRDLEQLYQDSPILFSSVIHAEPEFGSGQLAISSNADATALAIHGKQLIRQYRQKYGATCIHLVLYAPVGFCLFLGQQLSIVGDIVCYERVADRNYQPSLILSTQLDWHQSEVFYQESPDIAFDFLVEVLKVTQDSNANTQVVYPLLQANLNKLNDNLAQQLRIWATTTLPKLRRSQVQKTVTNTANFSNLIRQFPLGNKGCNIEIAITGYEIVAQVFTREEFPEQWAMLRNNLAGAYLERIRGERAENVERAISLILEALQVLTRQAFPEQWAITQNNLGEVYLARIRGTKAENIELAIAAFTNALNVLTRTAYPQQWATTQNNLGNAYSERILSERSENLEMAIACYQAALQIYTREAFLYEWASTCKNLGDAYTEKTHSDRLNNVDSLDNIEYAILFYEDALEIYNRETFPDECVIIREKLSNAHYLLEYYQRELELASLPQSIPHNEALARIEFVQGDLLDLDVDALVNPTGLDVSYGGGISLQLFQRLGFELYETLQKQPPLKSGEVFVTDAGSLPSRYLIHTPTKENEGRHTTTSIVRGVAAALVKADSLNDVQTIAFPSVGTGAAGFHPVDLAPKVLRAVINHLKQGSKLEKVIFAFIDEAAYQVYVSVYQTLLRETSLAYGISLTISPEATGVGGDIKASIYLKQIRADNQNDYLLQVPQTQAVGSELNIILTAPGFQFDSDNTASLPLDPDTAPVTQTAHFRLTALRQGTATITAELYCGDIFETNLETTVQVAGFDEESFLQTRITTQPRPVPQPDFMLWVQSVWNETNSDCIFNYQLRSFRFPTVFSGETNYQTVSFSSSWLKQMQSMLANTLENISGANPEDGKLSLVSLGQYLFQHLFPTELKSDYRSSIPQNFTSTLLIIADQDAWIPWELLHDGQKFLGDRFIIGHWLQELNDTKIYEFPVGAVNIAHYANVEHPQLWANLLETPGAPPPQLLPEGILHDSIEAIRGLHLIRYSQPSDAVNRRNAPIPINSTDDAEDIERQMRPAKLNFRRHRPFVTLSYVKTEIPELTVLEQTWASAFIRAGCSGFIGSLWAVEPSVEAAFMSCFYNRMWAGASLGEAFYTSRQLARAAAPDSLDWLAYVLYGDPMARPYRPVPGDGYAIVEPIGREIDDPLSPGVSARFRVSLRRSPPIWHKDRVIEVAENLAFENLQVHIVTYGLQIIPELPIAMTRTDKGDYLGWFTLVVPAEMTDPSALVQVYFADGMRPIHSLTFSFKIENRREE